MLPVPSDPEMRMPRTRAVLARLLPALPVLLLPLLSAMAVQAAVVTVTMVTDGPNGRFRFEPSIVRIQPGDTVRFVAHDPIHATKSVPGMLPEGATPWWGEMGEPLEVTLTVPGVYGFKCPSHYAVGMVGLIVVGDTAPNLRRARSVRHPRMAQQVFDRLFRAIACSEAAGGRLCSGH